MHATPDQPGWIEFKKHEGPWIMHFAHGYIVQQETDIVSPEVLQRDFEVGCVAIRCHYVGESKSQLPSASGVTGEGVGHAQEDFSELVTADWIRNRVKPF